MNDGQKMFHDFFMNLVKEGREEEAERLLLDGFKLQEEGKFDKAYLEEVSPKYFELIKEEEAEKLRTAMQSFSQRM